MMQKIVIIFKIKIIDKIWAEAQNLNQNPNSQAYKYESSSLFSGAQHSEFSTAPRVRTAEDLQLPSRKDQTQNLQNSEVHTARSIQLPARKDQPLQVSETDSECAEFRSSDCKEHPTIKQKRSNLARFENCNHL